MLDRLLGCLPGPVRHSLIRSRAVFNNALMDGVYVDVATDVETYLAAFRLVHEAYLGRGWITPQPSGLWVTPHHMLPESTIFVMRKGDACLGTVALIEDSMMGLPIDHTYPVETASLRTTGGRLVEVGSLAIVPEIRGSGLVALLMGAMWRYARERLHASDLVIAVSADADQYYEALFHFLTYTPVRHYEGFGTTATAKDYDPVVGLHQNIAAAMAFSDGCWKLPPEGCFNIRSLIEMPFPATFEHVPPPHLAEAELTRYKLSRAVFQRLFDEHTGLLANLDARTRAYLSRSRSRDTLQLPFDPRLLPLLEGAAAG